MSMDEEINPLMYNWNRVHMMYCDGGIFSGNNNTVTYSNGVPLFFRGARIIQAIKDDIVKTKGFTGNNIEDVVITGCSAGATAVIG